jgi:hypothetical protein
MDERLAASAMSPGCSTPRYGFDIDSSVSLSTSFRKKSYAFRVAHKKKDDTGVRAVSDTRFVATPARATTAAMKRGATRKQKQTTSVPTD